MKKKMMLKVLSVLSIASAAFIFAGCGKSQKTEPTPVDDEIKYDKNLKMKYKEFNGEAEIVEIEKQGATLTIPNTIGENNAKVTRVSFTYADDKDLTKVVFSDNLVYFNGNGFMNCSNLETVEFGSNPQITTIPSKAFLGTKISSITIPASVKSISYEAFQNVETLTNVTIASESNLEIIGPFAFYNCNKITGINLPETLVTISDSAFEKCSSLSTITFDSATNLTSIDQSAFSGCVGITALDFSSNTKLSKIGANAFRGCTELGSIKFNNGIKEIGAKAFYNTQKTTTVTLPESLTAVGDEAFVNAGLTELNIKAGSDIVIGNNAFTQYERQIVDRDYKEGEPIEYVLIPLEKIEKLTANGSLSIATIFTSYAPQVRKSLVELHVTGDKIAANAYKGCANLVTLDVANTVKAMGESAFEECTGVTEITLNEGLTEISKNTFKNCINLEAVTLPSTVTKVREGGFDGCVKVSTLSLDNIIFIGANAFRNTAIPTPTFSANIETIGENAFEGCSEIDEVNIITGANVVTVVKQFAFTNCINITSIKFSSGTIVEPNAFVGDTNVTTLETRGEYGLDSLFGESRETVAQTINSIKVLAGTEIIEGKAFSGCILVSEIIIPETVTEIGEEAFKGCGGIETLALPNGLTKAGKYAFADCGKLVIDALPENVVLISEGLFQNDSSISTFTINENITSIGAHAFDGCSNLVINSLNDSITTIGDAAFKGCVNLELNALPAELKTLGAEAFSGCLLIKINKTNENLTSMGDKAFSGCQAITSFEFVNDLGANEKLGKAVLEGCTKIDEVKVFGTSSLEQIFGDTVGTLKNTLSKIVLKGTEIELAANMFKGFTAISTVQLEDTEHGVITKIGMNAFEGCESLTEFIGMANVKEIGSNAFAGSGITNVIIPSNGIILGESIFAGCKSLHEVTFEPSVEDDKLNLKEIPNGTFQNTILVSITIPNTVERIHKKAFNNILTLSEVNIDINSSRLVFIGEDAFSGCTNLKNFTISKNVEAMGDNAFSGCITLKNVEFATNNKIEYIANGGFANCMALTTINLPNTIREIRSNAFLNCGCLTNLVLPTSLQTFGESAFEGAVSINNLVIPEKIQEIPAGTFKSCYMLENVDWETANNGNIKIIGDEAFFNTPYKGIVPKSVNKIGSFAFANSGEKDSTDAFKYPRPFTGVTDVINIGTENDGVGLIIGEGAFQYSGITNVALGAKVTEIGEGTFLGSTLSSANLKALKVTLISNSMFEECASLTTVDMTDNTTINAIGSRAFYKSGIGSFAFGNILSIGAEAFEECGALSIELALGTGTNNVSIGQKAFYKSGITSLTLGAKVINLGPDAFSESESLVSANLSALDITGISNNFFAKCTELAEVSINVEKIRTIGESAFEGTKIANLNFLQVEGKTTVLEQILGNAFKECKSITTATIPDSVTYVGVGAFNTCSALTTVNWSTNCNAINDDTFNGCNNLTSFVVPENVNNIGKRVFQVQTAGTITFNSVTPPSIDVETFSDPTKFTLKVPNVDNYESNYGFKVAKDNGATIVAA
ncbi:MAG: leucine-rich repeat domain-containing protein [bacterium]|nr:leucine-rich repeat domain-containing protein [bacterium]